MFKMNIIIIILLFGIGWTEEITLQNGLNGYDGCIDSWASQKRHNHKPAHTEHDYWTDPLSAADDKEMYVKFEFGRT